MTSWPACLSSIVLKPALHCNARCAYCGPRRVLHHGVKDQPTLGIHEWKLLLLDAKKLGANSVHISGGEPLLYSRLRDLVHFARRLGMKVNLNTNGYYLVEEDVVTGLVEAGINTVTISLPSHDPFLHDYIKGIDGIHDRCTKALLILNAAGVETYAQTILLKDTLLFLDEFLRWLLVRTHVKAVFISYTEGLYGNWYPNEMQINQFVNRTLEQAEKVVLTHLNDEYKREAVCALRTLFSKFQVSRTEIAAGVYNRSPIGKCRVPYQQALVLGNGDVHPCNAVEYFHSPVAGNIMHENLSGIFQGKIYEQVRNEGTQWCATCPVMHHICLNLGTQSLLRGPTGLLGGLSSRTDA